MNLECSDSTYDTTNTNDMDLSENTDDNTSLFSQQVLNNNDVHQSNTIMKTKCYFNKLCGCYARNNYSC